MVRFTSRLSTTQQTGLDLHPALASHHQVPLLRPLLVLIHEKPVLARQSQLLSNAGTFVQLEGFIIGPVAHMHRYLSNRPSTDLRYHHLSVFHPLVVPDLLHRVLLARFDVVELFLSC